MRWLPVWIVVGCAPPPPELREVLALSKPRQAHAPGWWDSDGRGRFEEPLPADVRRFEVWFDVLMDAEASADAVRVQLDGQELPVDVEFAGNGLSVRMGERLVPGSSGTLTLGRGVQAWSGAKLDQRWVFDFEIEP